MLQQDPMNTPSSPLSVHPLWEPTHTSSIPSSPHTNTDVTGTFVRARPGTSSSHAISSARKQSLHCPPLLPSPPTSSSLLKPFGDNLFSFSSFFLLQSRLATFLLFLPLGPLAHHLPFTDAPYSLPCPTLLSLLDPLPEHVSVSPTQSHNLLLPYTLSPFLPTSPVKFPFIPGGDERVQSLSGSMVVGYACACQQADFLHPHNAGDAFLTSCRCWLGDSEPHN